MHLLPGGGARGIAVSAVSMLVIKSTRAGPCRSRGLFNAARLERCAAGTSASRHARRRRCRERSGPARKPPARRTGAQTRKRAVGERASGRTERARGGDNDATPSSRRLAHHMAVTQSMEGRTEATISSLEALEKRIDALQETLTRPLPTERLADGRLLREEVGFSQAPAVAVHGAHTARAGLPSQFCAQHPTLRTVVLSYRQVEAALQRTQQLVALHRQHVAANRVNLADSEKLNDSVRGPQTLGSCALSTVPHRGPPWPTVARHLLIWIGTAAIRYARTPLLRNRSCDRHHGCATDAAVL